MKRVFGVIVVCAGLSISQSAFAQTQPAAAGQAANSSGPVVNMWYAGATTGVAVVEKFGNAVSGEAGVRVFRNLDIVGDVTWMQNVVARRQIDLVNLVASNAKSGGTTATASMKVPAIAGGIGLRYVLESAGRYRPYAIITYERVHTEKKPSFSLNGADVTSSLNTFGITIGSDIIGKENHNGVMGGVGLLMRVKEKFYVDGSARLLSFDDNGSRTNVARLALGGGIRF